MHLTYYFVWFNVQLNQKVAIAMLEKMNHSVVLAENGLEAVNKWRATLSPEAIALGLPVDLDGSPTGSMVHMPLTKTMPMSSSPDSDLSLSIVAIVSKSSTPDLVTTLGLQSFDICLMDLSMPVRTFRFLMFLG